MATSCSSRAWRFRKRRWLLLAAALAVALGLLPPRVPAGDRATPVVFPTADELPANHLKFYLHFPEPMQEGVFLEHCRLLDEHGQAVAEPFRETELWSGDRRRLTLWLHPGRQKTGVNLNEELGPVLEPGRGYTLIVSGRWPTERGVALGGDVRKRFRAGAPVRRQLSASEWKIEAPRAASREPLVVRFPAPLDYALLLRCLTVKIGGEPVLGKVEVGEQERSWRFTPAQPWRDGEHMLVAQSILEDLAGNSLARPFEVDLQAAAAKPVGREVTVRWQPLPENLPAN